MALPEEVKFYLEIPGHRFAFPRQKFSAMYPNSILTQDLAEHPAEEEVTFALTNPMFTPEALTWMQQFTEWKQIPGEAPPEIAEIGNYLNIDFFGAVTGREYEAFAAAKPDLALLRFEDLEVPSNYQKILYYSLAHGTSRLALYTFAATNPANHSVDDARFLVAASYAGNYPIVNALLTSRQVNPVTAKLPLSQWRYYSPDKVSPFLVERFEGKTGSQSLYYAILEGHSAIVHRLLLDERVNPAADSGFAATLAIDAKNMSSFEELLPRLDLEKDGYALLHHAVFMQSPASIALLLPYVDPTAHNNALLMLAVKFHLIKSLQALLQDPKVRDWSGEGLEYAIRAGYDDIVNLLLEMKAEPEITEAVWQVAQNKPELLQRLAEY